MVASGSERSNYHPDQLVTGLPILDSQLLAQEILAKQLRGKRWEVIPVDQINMSIKIVDQTHVDDLGNSIFGRDNKGGLGQISPIITAAFASSDADENIIYVVTDGFHRTETFIQRGSATIEAIVLYGIGLEEMYDLRILAANSVKSTSFARIAEWMQRSFEETKWFKEKDLTLLQAFSLCIQDTSGIRLQLEPDEAIELKKWVETKANSWGKRIPSIWQDLIIISKADPDLVRLVRVGKGGGHGEGRGVMNPARLRAIVNNLPVDSGLQRKVADAVIWGDLDASKTNLLAQVVRAVQNEPDTVEFICSQPNITTSILEVIPDDKRRSSLMKEVLAVSGYHELDNNKTIQLAQAVVAVGDNEEEKDRLYEDPKGYLRDHQPSLLVQPGPTGPGPITRPEYGGDGTGYIRQLSVPELEKQIEALNNALSIAEKRRGAGHPWLSSKRTWWKTIPNLSLDEREALSLVIEEKNNIKKAAKLMDKTQHQVIKLITSGLQRHLLYTQQSLEDWFDSIIYSDQS